jgi:hypothetical protein
MRQEADELRAKIERLEDELTEARRRLGCIESNCDHRECESIGKRVDEQKAYTIPAVELGSDSRPAVHVPAKRTVYYQGRCVRCGKIQETVEVKPTGFEPDFSKCL